MYDWPDFSVDNEVLYSNKKELYSHGKLHGVKNFVVSIFVIYQRILVTCISSKVGFFNSSVSNGSLYSMNPLGFDTTLPTPPGFAVKVL